MTDKDERTNVEKVLDRLRLTHGVPHIQLWKDDCGNWRGRISSTSTFGSQRLCCETEPVPTFAAALLELDAKAARWLA